MILPRRRITSLTVISIFVLTVWYLKLFPSFSTKGPEYIPPVEVTTKPTVEPLGLPDDVGTSVHSIPEQGFDAPGPAVELLAANSEPSSTSGAYEEILVDHKPAPMAPAPSASSKLYADTPVAKVKPQKPGQFTFGNKTYYEKWPVEKIKQLSTKKALKLPSLQRKAEAESPETRKKRVERLDAVKESFAHSWVGYKMHAWKQDELKPIEGGGLSSFGGWAATLVDALDTLWIMGMKSEFREAVDAIRDIDFTATDEETLNVFETTIRYLGGFLGAYDLTHGEEEFPVLLQKAVDVADFLYCSFDTPNRMPASVMNP